MEDKSEKIRKILLENPNSSAKHVCEKLGLNYSECRNLIYKVKHQVKNLNDYGRVQKSPCQRHRVEWCVVGGVPDAIVNRLFEVCVYGNRVGKPILNNWYVSKNKNKMLCYVDDDIRVRVFKSGTCRVLSSRKMSQLEVQRAVRDAFIIGIGSEDSEWLDKFTIDVMSQHRTFPVGQDIPPFKIPHYRDSLGLTVKADKSHPQHIEVEESYPLWVRDLIKSQSVNQAMLAEVLGSLISGNEKRNEDLLRRHFVT